MRTRFARPLMICAVACGFSLDRSPIARAALKEVTPAKSRAALPAEVRALMPAGATSLHFGRLPAGPRNEARLVHIWATPRKNQSDYANSLWLPSPICVDVFEAGSKPGAWKFAASTVYLGSNQPTDIEARWLQPQKKQGPVIVLITPAYMHTLYTVITFPNVGTEEWDNFGAVQEFSQGGVGGGKILQYFGIDRRGYMTVETVNTYAGKLQSKTVRAWNGRQYVAPAKP